MAKPGKRSKSAKRARKKRLHRANGAHGAGGGHGRAWRTSGAVRDTSPDVAVVHLVSFEITDEPLPHPSMNLLPAEVDLRLDDLYLLARSDPAGALAEVEALHERFPKAVAITNWLVVCWNALGREEEALRLAETLLAENPDYLFGRITLAELYLNQSDLEAADRVLGKVKHFCALCPGRKVFHISEVIAYVYTFGKYLVMNGNIGAAENCLDFLEEIDPEGLATRELARMVSLGNGFAFRAIAALKDFAADLRRRKNTGRRRGAASRTAAGPSDRTGNLFEGGGVELEAGAEEER